VRTHEAGISLDPRFGLMSRTGATWSTALIVLLLWVAFRTAALNQLYLPAFAMLLGVVWDVYRYILTEHAMDSVRQVYLATLSHHA
jgi:hypothetical protein